MLRTMYAEEKGLGEECKCTGHNFNGSGKEQMAWAPQTQEEAQSREESMSIPMIKFMKGKGGMLGNREKRTQKNKDAEDNGAVVETHLIKSGEERKHAFAYSLATVTNVE